MHDDVPSRTAAWVALLRGLGRYLPPDLRLIEDPFGLRFAGDLGPAPKSPKSPTSASCIST